MSYSACPPTPLQAQRLDWNAISVPSGDHAGYSPQISVICRRPEPSAFITYKCVLPLLPAAGSRAELNTIRVPSGDQVAPQLPPSGRLLRLTNPEPSAFTMPMSPRWSVPTDWVSRTRSRCPSGDHLGQHAPPARGPRAGAATRRMAPPGCAVQNTIAA